MKGFWKWLASLFVKAPAEPAPTEAQVQLKALGALIAGAESALNTLELKGRELDVTIDRREGEMAALEREIDQLAKAGGSGLKLEKKRGELAALKVRVNAFRDTVKAHGIDYAKQGKALEELKLAYSRLVNAGTMGNASPADIGLLLRKVSGLVTELQQSLEVISGNVESLKPEEYSDWERELKKVDAETAARAGQAAPAPAAPVPAAAPAAAAPAAAAEENPKELA